MQIAVVFQMNVKRASLPLVVFIVVGMSAVAGLQLMEQNDQALI
ncbi:MAG: hypothetical protein PXX83_04365 [Candidatus Nitrosotalea sp.]|nr:hypothetical protein [Candidatus Nitrosotalea sp.]